MNPLHAKLGFLCDMDGVIYHGNRLLPGVEAFVKWLEEAGKHYLFLTNSSQLSPRELSQKLARLGLTVGEEHFYTSALATAAFLASQKPDATLYVIGEPGLITALYGAGFSMNEVNPDYVVVGETRSYNFEKIEQAIRCVLKGAKLIGTNPDLTGPVEGGIVPATGALMAPIELSTGVKAYYVGKPNPLMMRHALRQLGCRREDTAIIGDRMDTDIIAGIESDIQSVLVLTGVTRREDLPHFSWRPGFVLNGVGDVTLPELP